MKDPNQARLELLRAEVARFETVAAFARAYDLDPTYIRQLLNQKRAFGEKAARRMGEKFGNEEYFTPGRIESDHGEKEPKQENVTTIPRMNGKAKGGSGCLAPTHEYVIGSISVTNEWINRSLSSITAKRNLAVIEAYGRSMEPTLMSGDLLVVDTGVHDAKIDGIYILQRLNTPEPEIMVKRLQRTLDGGLIVRSDNRAEYDPETVPASEISERVRIIGRVVWVWAGREA